MNKSFTVTFLAIIAVASSIGSSSCTSCHRQSVSVRPDIAIAISDPWLKKLAAVTDTLSIKGRGELRAGRYNFAGKTLTIAGGTQFEIDMAVRFSGAPEIGTNTVDGNLNLSVPIEFDNIPSPTAVVLKQGEATIEMDFARMLFALMVKGLQQRREDAVADQSWQRLQELPDKVEVSLARIDLKPGAQLDLTGLSARIGDGSFISLKDVVCRNAMNYRGKLAMDLKLSEGSVFQWDKIECRSKSGKVLLNADMEAHEGTISATSYGKDKNCRITLDGCSAKLAEKGAPSSKARGAISVDSQAARLEISLSKLGLSKPAVSASPPSVNMTGSVEMVDSNLSIVSRSESVSLTFPQRTVADVVAALSSDSAPDISLKIENGIKARDLSWASTRGANSLKVDLREVALDNLRVNSSTGVDLVVDAVAVKPASLSWRNRRATIDVLLDPSSKVTSKEPMRFAFDGTALVAPAIVPLSLSGDVDIKDRKYNVFQLRDLSGDCTVSSSKDLKLDAAVHMKVSTNAELLGIRGFRGGIGKLKITGSKDHMRLDIVDGEVSIPLDDLRQAIKAKLPDPTVLNVDECLLEKKKWRYKNFKLKKIVVRHPHIERIQVDKVNAISVDADADLALVGTVEVYHQKLNPLSKTPSQWKEHEWKANAHISEDGIVDYKLIAGKTIADSKIHLDTKIDVSYPERLDIDWSAVAGDSLAKAENQLLQMALSTAKSLALNKSKLITYSGDLPLIKSTDRRLRSIRISKFKVIPAGKNIVVRFDGFVEL